MAKYKFVFFDLDGTISNSYEGIARSLDATFGHYGINVDKSLYPGYIGPPLSDTFKLYFPPEKVGEVVAWFRDNYVKGDIFRNPVYDGIPEVMKELKEPFGAEANNATSGVSETGKSGSLVSSFVESFYAETQMPVVAVSCSKGGTPIEFWDTDGSAYSDALSRLEGARDFIAQDESMDLAHTYVVWCQGETDAENHTSEAEYQAAVEEVFALHSPRAAL